MTGELTSEAQLEDFVRWSDIAQWRNTVPKDAASWDQVNKFFSASELPKAGWTVYSTPRPDDAEKVDTWVKYTELQAFGDMVSDFAGIYLPPYPGKKVPLDATTMAYYRVSSKADYKRIGKQVAEKKRVHSLTSTLTEAREDFQSKARLYVAIDFEQWEKGHSKILEFGISQVEVQESSATSTQQDWQVKTRHILIAEYLHLRNGDYVPDNSQNFRHGVSEKRPLREAIEVLETILSPKEGLETVMVFHDARADLAMMESLGVSYPSTIPIYDTRDLFAARENSAKGDYRSLTRMLDALDILAFSLHNAGNDSHATLQAYIKMCSESDQGNVKKSRIESADHEVNDQDDCHSLGDEDS